MKFRIGSFVVGFENGDDLRLIVEEAVSRVRKRASGDFRSAAELSEQVEMLKIEKGRREEEFARRDREIEHKVGLERTRQSQEIDIARRETKVAVREENLSAQEERFEEHMDFMTKRFEGEVEHMRGMVEDMIGRLPSAEIIANLTNQPHLKAVGDDD